MKRLTLLVMVLVLLGLGCGGNPEVERVYTVYPNGVFIFKAESPEGIASMISGHLGLHPDKEIVSAAPIVQDKLFTKLGQQTGDNAWLIITRDKR